MTIYKKLFNVKKEGITLVRNQKAFNYKYATLDQIQTKLGDILEKEKLLVVHFIKDGNVITQIRDIEGEEYVESSIPMTEGVKAQDKGSEITYFRRYNLLSLLDLEVADDDGKKAQDSSIKKLKYLNFEDFEAIIEAGNTTESEIANIIKEDGYTLSKYAKNAVRKFVDEGILDKNLFFSDK